MDANDVALIRVSFAKVAPIAEDAAAMFYARLFETAPEVKPLFKGDMKAQGKKLMGALYTVVEQADRPDNLVPVLQAMGRRHADYGVTPAHYAPVGAALLWTLEKGLGVSFTPDVEAAWAKAYQTVSEIMIQAAAPELDEAS